ncbi:TetR family transcriptional regulator, partial [Mycolicibacterium pulveris]
IKSGEITIDAPSNEMLARIVIGVSWIPENLLHDLGTRASQIHVRDTLLRGVIAR